MSINADLSQSRLIRVHRQFLPEGNQELKVFGIEKGFCIEPCKKSLSCVKRANRLKFIPTPVNCNTFGENFPKSVRLRGETPRFLAQSGGGCVGGENGGGENGTGPGELRA
jgi:hypothetical protein